jgi:hypothetical protein
VQTLNTLAKVAVEKEVSPRTGEKYAICLSFYELYQDRIYDLLDDQQSFIQKRKHLPLKRDVTSGRRFVSGLRKIYADTLEEAFWILSRGIAARQSNETAMNTSSSRSHAIFTIELKTFLIQTQTVHTSQLNIVDLAGSERSRSNTADRLAETGSINRSLMVLGQCIEGLRNSRKSSSSGHGSSIVIPFRQNKLTEMLFGNAILKRDTRAVMIVNLSRTTAYEENVGILRYASLAHEIEALPASELGGSLSRSSSGEVRAEECTNWHFECTNLSRMERETGSDGVHVERRGMQTRRRGREIGPPGTRNVAAGS